MDIRFSGKNFTLSEPIKEHLREKITKFEKYAPRIVESHVMLKKEKYLYEAEITLLAKNLRAYGEGISKENVYTAIDQACMRVEKQLKRYREKVKDHKKKSADKLPPSSEASQLEVGSNLKRPSIISSKAFEPKPMSQEEASLQLELSEKTFLVFLNASTKTVNVVFKREDGNHGLIEPKF